MLMLSLSLGCSTKSAESAPQRPLPLHRSQRLFGTVEFKGPLRALDSWIRILEQGDAQIADLLSCNPRNQVCSPASSGLQQMIKKAAGLPPQKQLKVVNSFFNRWPYRLDQDAYGRSDYWATPAEFLRTSGDCEDFGIVKYFALKQLGFDTGKMRIVVLKDQIRNIGHAVLVVYLDKEIYVLDSLTDLVLPHFQYTHYLPQYSVNEFHRWTHVRPLEPASR